jgi:DNA-binding transcriptional LysR family regulator
MLAAAEAESISQPGISAHVKALEAYFGTPLLERVGRRVRPTAAGELVAAATRRVANTVDELDHALADLAGLRSGRLVIGASSTVGETWLPEILGRFRRAHPAVYLEVRLGNSETMLRAVREYTLAFAIVGRVEAELGLVARPVIDDHLELFVATASPWLERAPVRLADLAGETFVVREPGSATREVALRGLAAQHVSPTRTLALSSNEAVKRAVAAGLGVGILSAQTLVVDRRAGVIAILPCTDWSCRRQFWLVHRRDRLLSRAERAFLGLLSGDAGRSGGPGRDVSRAEQGDRRAG